MEIANWKEFPKRVKAAKKQGLVRGIGLGTYVEVCGTMGEETANVRLDPNGDISILIGTQSSGQGHQTAYAQLVAEQFGIRARARSCFSRRYRSGRHRSRHRRLGVDTDRRRQR